MTTTPVASGWRWLAARRWRQALDARRATLDAALQAARAAPPDAAALQARLRRAAARGEPALTAQALADGLAAAIAAVERQQGAPLAATVCDAALALRLGAAVELATTAERRSAIALAAAGVALGGESVHVVCAGDEEATATAQALQPLLQACGLRAAALTLDMPPAALAEAYRAPVVCAGVRRLAADRARDDTLVQRLGADGPVPRLVPPVRQAFVEPLDRLLADEALGPVQLSVADDPTRLGDALAAACRFVDTLQPGRDQADGQLLPPGRERLDSDLGHWPAAWRGQARSEALVRQALYVRDGLVAGRDYQRLGTGDTAPLWLDESLAERLPERDFAATLAQALQLRLGLPVTPVSRTIGRSSVPAFFARYARLAGAAPCLDGLDDELWRQYGLLRHAPVPLPRPACRVLGLPDAEAALQALSALAGGEETGLSRLVVLKRAGDAAALQARVAHPRAAWALEGGGPQAALAALAAQAPLGRLRVVFAEPMDHRRGERAWLLRAAEMLPPQAPPLEAVALVAADGRWLAQRLPWLAPALRALCRVWPRAALRLLPPLVALARATTARRASAHRASMPEREQQLRRQLSFTAAAAPPPEARRPHGRS